MEKDTEEEEREALINCKEVVAAIKQTLQTNPVDWERHLKDAQDTATRLDKMNFFSRQNSEQEQLWIIQGLQKFAYHDDGSVPVFDIANWCTRQLLEVMRLHPDSIQGLQGLGNHWLLEAQYILKRIRKQEARYSSETNTTITGSLRSTSSSPEAQANLERSEAEARANTADYVEARGLLLPATDYFARAVEAARSQDELSTDILVTAAEAFVDLGNVNGPRYGEQYFRRAVQYLREASAIAEYSLPQHLQQLLDDYGRLL